ncbi:hypothetical protein FKM82_002541 [Ascaphus truei]
MQLVFEQGRVCRVVGLGDLILIRHTAGKLLDLGRVMAIKCSHWILSACRALNTASSVFNMWMETEQCARKDRAAHSVKSCTLQNSFARVVLGGS